jgi:hypothetical protein
VQCPRQVGIPTDNGPTAPREIAGLAREDRTSATLGLALTEGKAIRKALQDIVVEQPMTAFLEPPGPGSHGGKLRRSTGDHTTRLRTIGGTLTVNSPRLPQCPCPSHPPKTCSPLAALLPAHRTPAWLFLETQGAA